MGRSPAQPLHLGLNLTLNLDIDLNLDLLMYATFERHACVEEGDGFSRRSFHDNREASEEGRLRLNVTNQTFSVIGACQLGRRVRPKA